ncbi:MAG: prepilin-type N-terminal cleavage/methylation domain-containing protein, partial [Planctomycetaceae bacterium]|nr:prepilin-type N-terminal cleavage/methylation domain-containing protein [Planctomycetaceae bacterium]
MRRISTHYRPAFTLVELLIAIAVIGIFIGICTTAMPVKAEESKNYTIANPYANVDWTVFGQYKAALHTHSTNSDGANTRAEMIEDHYAKGYDILNMADHDFVTTAWDEPGYGRGAGQNRPGIGALSTERRAEIETGVGRNGRGMIGIPFGNEQSATDHIITMWADFNNTAGAALTAEQRMAVTLGIAEFAGGIAVLAHPGRYTGGQNADLMAGAIASNNPAQIKKYADLFLAFPNSLVGMEIMNRLDNETRSDRILWDNILMQTMPKGKTVWGFSN